MKYREIRVSYVDWVGLYGVVQYGSQTNIGNLGSNCLGRCGWLSNHVLPQESPATSWLAKLNFQSTLKIVRCKSSILNFVLVQHLPTKTTNRKNAHPKGRPQEDPRVPLPRGCSRGQEGLVSYFISKVMEGGGEQLQWKDFKGELY